MTYYIAKRAMKRGGRYYGPGDAVNVSAEDAPLLLASKVIEEKGKGDAPPEPPAPAKEPEGSGKK